MPTEIGKGVTLIESARDWDVYAAQIAEDTEGNKGEERPGEYPCLVVTDVQYAGSVSIGPADYHVRHTFIYPVNARHLLEVTAIVGSAKSTGQPAKQNKSLGWVTESNDVPSDEVVDARGGSWLIISRYPSGDAYEVLEKRPGMELPGLPDKPVAASKIENLLVKAWDRDLGRPHSPYLLAFQLTDGRVIFQHST